MTNKTDWKEWLQILSNFAILMGLIFVYWEIQQNQALTRIQLSSDAMIMRAERANSLMGESPELVLIKACLQPDELGASDKIVLGQIFQSRLAEAARSRNTALDSDIGISYELAFEQAFRTMFNYKYGHDYYARLREVLPEDLVEIGDRELALDRTSDCSEGSTIPGGF